MNRIIAYALFRLATLLLLLAGSAAPAAAPPRLALPLARSSFSGAFGCTALRPDGKAYAVTQRFNEDPYLVDIATGKRSPLPLKGDRCWGALAFSPDGRVLAAGTDKGVSLLDGWTGRLVRTFPTPAGRPHDLTFSPDGARLAFCAEYDSEEYGLDRVAVFDVKSGREAARFHHRWSANGLAWSSDGLSLLTFGLGPHEDRNTVKLWDLRPGDPRERLSFRPRDDCYSAALSPDGRTVVTGESVLDRENAVQRFPGFVITPIKRVEVVLRDAATGRPRGRLPRQPGTGVDSLAYTRDGRLLAAGVSGAVRLFDPATGRLLGEAPRLFETDRVTRLEFSADGTRLAVQRRFPFDERRRMGGEVQVWDVRALLRAHRR